MTTAAPIGDRCYCPDDCNCHYPWRTNYCGCRHHEVPAPAPSAAAIRATVERGAHDAINAYGKVV
jgi:hypothetical protein